MDLFMLDCIKISLSLTDSNVLKVRIDLSLCYLDARLKDLRERKIEAKIY
jgi:hypothetical protein